MLIILDLHRTLKKLLDYYYELISVLVVCFYVLVSLHLRTLLGTPIIYQNTNFTVKKKLLSTYIIFLATHHDLLFSLYMLSLQGKDSRSEYRTIDLKHLLALSTAAIVYING